MVDSLGTPGVAAAAATTPSHSCGLLTAVAMGPTALGGAAPVSTTAPTAAGLRTRTLGAATAPRGRSIVAGSGERLGSRIAPMAAPGRGRTGRVLSRIRRGRTTLASAFGTVSGTGARGTRPVTRSSTRPLITRKGVRLRPTVSRTVALTGRVAT